MPKIIIYGKTNVTITLDDDLTEMMNVLYEVFHISFGPFVGRGDTFVDGKKKGGGGGDDEGCK